MKGIVILLFERYTCPIGKSDEPNCVIEALMHSFHCEMRPFRNRVNFTVATFCNVPVSHMAFLFIDDGFFCACPVRHGYYFVLSCSCFFGGFLTACTVNNDDLLAIASHHFIVTSASLVMLQHMSIRPSRPDSGTTVMTSYKTSNHYFHIGATLV